MNRKAALARIRADLARHRELFRLDRDGLGAALCKAATDGVQACIAGEHAPDGTPWPALSEAYDEWKGFAYPGRPMALLHGVMANPREVAGTRDVRPEKATVTYGLTEEARQEAGWFQEGVKETGQPPRPFWGFTADSLATVRGILDARFATA